MASAKVGKGGGLVGSGGGVVLGAAMAAPVAPGFTSGATPLVWVELLDRLNVTHVWAKVDLPDPATYYHGMKAGRVRNWGTLTRALSDRDGQHEQAECTWTQSDTDRSVRALVASSSTQALRAAPVSLRLIDDASRRAGLTPQTVFRGYLEDYAQRAPLLSEFKALDTVTARFAPLAAETQIPQRTVAIADFSDAPAAAVSQPVPIIYGTHDDSAATNKGAIPTLYVGKTYLPVLGKYCHTFLIAGHAVAAVRYSTGAGDAGNYGIKTPPIIGWYVDGVLQSATVNAANAVWIVPGYMTSGPTYATTNWGGSNRVLASGGVASEQDCVDSVGYPHAPSGYPMYWDVNGNRYLVIFGRQQADGAANGDADACASGTKTLTVNLHGIESQGDGTGTELFYAHDQYLHALQNWVWRNYASGTWQGTPAFEDDASIGQIDDSSFATAKALSATHLAALDSTRLPTITSHSGGLASPGSTTSYVLTVSGSSAYGYLESGPSVAVTIPDIVPDATGQIYLTFAAPTNPLVPPWQYNLYRKITGAYGGPYGYSGAYVRITFQDVKFTDFLDGISPAVDSPVRNPPAASTSGYLGAMAIGTKGEQVSARDLIARFNQACDTDSGCNKAYQFMVSAIDVSASTLAAATAVSAQNDILAGPFEIPEDMPSHANVLTYRYQRDYTGTHGSDGWDAGGSASDATSIAAYTRGSIGGRVPGKAIEFYGVRDSATAATIVAQQLLRRKHPPRRVQFTMGLQAANYELGQILNITHYGGLGASGWTNQPVRIIRIEVDLDACVVHLEGYDLSGVIAG